MLLPPRSRRGVTANKFPFIIAQIWTLSWNRPCAPRMGSAGHARLCQAGVRLVCVPKMRRRAFKVCR